MIENMIVSVVVAYLLIAGITWIFLGYYSEDLKKRTGMGLRFRERFLISFGWIYWLINA